MYLLDRIFSNFGEPFSKFWCDQIRKNPACVYGVFKSDLEQTGASSIYMYIFLTSE